MSLGVVILSNAATDDLAALTQRTLDTLKGALGTLEASVVVVEQCDERVWPGTLTVYPRRPFHFNAFVNLGVRMIPTSHVLICNNDLEFEPDSVSLLYDYARSSGVAAVCPVCPTNDRQRGLAEVEYGFEIGKHFSGWCFLLRRDAWETIGGLDEDFAFWYADDATVEQLKRVGLEVAVLSSAKVIHHANGTLRTLERRKRIALTRHQKAIFVAKYGKL